MLFQKITSFLANSTKCSSKSLVISLDKEVSYPVIYEVVIQNGELAVREKAWYFDFFITNFIS